MNEDKPTLQQIAQQASARNDGKRGRALGRIAEKHGLTLSYTTVDKILSGKYNSRPTKQTLEALAVLAGVSKEQVYEAAGEPMPSAPLIDQLPPDVDLLTADQRRVVIDLARVFISQNRAYMALEREHEELTADAPPITRTGVSPDEYDLAAYTTGKESMGRRLRREQDEAAETTQEHPNE